MMKTMRYEAIEGEMLKKFKDTEGFVERVGLSQSTFFFFNIGLAKLFLTTSSFKKSKPIITLF